MSGTQPVAVYAMKVPPGDIMVPACPEFAAMFRVSMAAIDPSAEPEISDNDDKKPPRATLKIVRIPSDMLEDDSDESDDEDYLNGMDDDEEITSDEDGEVNGGPSNLKKTKKNKLLDLIRANAEDEDEEMGEDDESDSDDEDDAQAQAILKKLMKGKDKAVNGDESSSDIDEDEEGLEMEEVVICTLDTQSHYQQPLDFVVGEDEKIFFKVTGTHTVHLTGNYVIPLDDGPRSLYDEDDEGYDLDPEEDELDELDELDEDEESDELDDLEDPRVTEVNEEEEQISEPVKKPAKGKNKRPAEDSADEEAATLDDIMAKSTKAGEATAPATNGDSKKLSKAEKKKLKKLKKNDGEAAAVTSETVALSSSAEPKAKTPEPKKEAAQTNGNGSEKKVQFAKNLEQGPTGSASPAGKTVVDTKKSSTGTLGVRDVQGVTVDDRKLGSGPVAKKGNKIDMRYIGKLENGKVFDSNKSGKPFSFKLGAGEVIKGWDIGLAGIAVGGERRLTIPAELGYGKKGAKPDIPGNAKLIFDVKCLNVK